MNEKQSLVSRLQFVTFDLPRAETPLTMALNVQKVKEVVEAGNLSPIPDGCTGILGVYDLRGCPVPVLAIHEMVSTRSRTKSEDDLIKSYTRYVICDLQNLWIAIPVQKTGRILSCNSSDFLPPPALTAKESVPLVSGLIRREGHYVPVLNLDRVLDSILMGEDEIETLPSQEMDSGFTGKRILLIDDSKSILKKLRSVFERLGLTVVSAADGEEGLQRLTQSQTRFDLIFTDIEMPLLDGIGFARKVKLLNEFKDIPIVFNSALSNPALIEDIESEKLGSYIVKFDQNEIIRTLKKLISKI